MSPRRPPAGRGQRAGNGDGTPRTVRHARAGVSTSATPAPIGRLDAIDAARGAALCAMIAYHFCFDLRHFGLLAADFEHDPFWLGARALILGTFMALVGVSLVLAERAGASTASFWRRLGVIAAGAGAVSLASFVVFPQSFITFGVLHCIAVATLLSRPLVTKPGLALALGVAMIGVGNLVSHPVFDAPALSFIGLRTSKPLAEDFVPLLPWAGVTLLGAAAARYALTPHATAALARLPVPRSLAWMGRHSLAIYLVHQPLLFGLLWLAASLGVHR
jgi:uncharacterized membrane protein